MPVLERFNYQLIESNLNTSNTLKPDFSWAVTDISEIRNFMDNVSTGYLQRKEEKNKERSNMQGRIP